MHLSKNKVLILLLTMTYAASIKPVGEHPVKKDFLHYFNKKATMAAIVTVWGISWHCLLNVIIKTASDKK